MDQAGGCRETDFPRVRAVARALSVTSFQCRPGKGNENDARNAQCIRPVNRPDALRPDRRRVQSQPVEPPLADEVLFWAATVPAAALVTVPAVMPCAMPP